MTIRLPEDLESFVRDAVHRGHFANVNDAVAEIVRDYFQNPPPQATPEQPAAGDGETAEKSKPIWEKILERSAKVPDEEWNKLPIDLAEQHDHYLYGSPKRSTQ